MFRWRTGPPPYARTGRSIDRSRLKAGQSSWMSPMRFTITQVHLLRSRTVYRVPFEIAECPRSGCGEGGRVQEEQPILANERVDTWHQIRTARRARLTAAWRVDH